MKATQTQHSNATPKQKNMEVYKTNINNSTANQSINNNIHSSPSKLIESSTTDNQKNNHNDIQHTPWKRWSNKLILNEQS